jgi:hypothetical protein
VGPERRRRKSVRTGKSVEEWMGQRVTVGMLRDMGVVGRFGCTLEGVDESGIVVGYDSKDGEKMTRFYPWHTVLYMQLAENAGEEPPRQLPDFSS